ncbi:hypothetical protein K474DRAFT_1660200 [Panus rudis PR-1116 ss-1]|nr:hypothetical protein K474DRAFT_1660200 [Panus rudis PR-1116 ss-1]
MSPIIVPPSPLLSQTPESVQSVSPTKPHGRRRALLVAICYTGSNVNREYGELKTPRQDAADLKQMLMDRYKFQERDIVVMLDDPNGGPLHPTKENILRQMRRFTEEIQPGDSLVFLYAGHSDQIDAVVDINEYDGRDEVILPIDHQGLSRPEYLILDDELREHLVTPLPAGSRLTAIFDCCHSATLLDLRHDLCNDPLGEARPVALLVVVIMNAKRMSRRRMSLRRERTMPNVHAAEKLSQSGSSTGQTIGSSKAEEDKPDYPNSAGPSVPHVRTPRKRSSSGESVNSRGRKRHKLTNRPCNGRCRPSPTRRPDVVSVSACGDPQMTWESADHSLTKAIIDTLGFVKFRLPHLPLTERSVRGRTVPFVYTTAEQIEVPSTGLSHQSQSMGSEGIREAE